MNNNGNDVFELRYFTGHTVVSTQTVIYNKPMGGNKFAVVIQSTNPIIQMLIFYVDTGSTSTIRSQLQFFARLIENTKADLKLAQRVRVTSRAQKVSHHIRDEQDLSVQFRHVMRFHL